MGWTESRRHSGSNELTYKACCRSHKKPQLCDSPGICGRLLDSPSSCAELGHPSFTNLPRHPPRLNDSSCSASPSLPGPGPRVCTGHQPNGHAPSSTPLSPTLHPHLHRPTAEHPPLTIPGPLFLRHSRLRHAPHIPYSSATPSSPRPLLHQHQRQQQQHQPPTKNHLPPTQTLKQRPNPTKSSLQPPPHNLHPKP